MSLTTVAAVHERLTGLSIPFDKFEHPAVMTVPEWNEQLPVADAIYTKSLVLSGKGGVFLVVAAGDTKTDFKTVATAVGVKPDLRFATEAKVNTLLASSPGSVNPFAIANDTAKEVTLVLDSTLATAPAILFHPAENTATVKISGESLLAFFKAVDRDARVVDFAALAAEAAAAPAAAPVPKKEKANAALATAAKAMLEGETLLGITIDPKVDFRGWYSEVIIKSELIEYYNVSGCYILRPWAFAIWENIQRWLNDRIIESGVENSSFPLFVTKDALEVEKKHVEDFAPEVAWVTRSGEKDLPQPIAIRPTSETVMYPAFAKWIRSHRDLPLRLNQWCNVVRWEFSHPTPFIRTREFLWQEGHTAFATRDEAIAEMHEIWGYYAGVYQDLLAIPVIPGEKTEHERFPGGDITTTVEAYIPGAGRGVQGATSHCLGQNFGKMFDISFQDTDGKAQIPWQNSWGLTTRTIGVMVMVHGDEKGLVLPPRVAAIQAVVIPVGITGKTSPEEEAAIHTAARNIDALLRAHGIKTKLDNRRDKTSGWRFAHWELKGTPLRIEVGPKDIAQGQISVWRRVDGKRFALPIGDADIKGDAVTLPRIPFASPLVAAQAMTKLGGLELADGVRAALDDVHATMFANATTVRDAHLTRAADWKTFCAALAKSNIIIAPHCDVEECEELVKKESAVDSVAEDVEEDERAPSMGAKALCKPFAENKVPPAEGTKCFRCGKDAKCITLWGRSF